VAREVAKRAVAFEMRLYAYDLTWDAAFAQERGITRQPTAEGVLRSADVIALYMSVVGIS
jgi:phosphoglycerate dehydrogenase-like enzyme